MAKTSIIYARKISRKIVDANRDDFLFIQDQGEFDWSPTIQSAISGSFYWCYILSQVVGGVLTQYFGTKAVFGGSQLITAICSLLMPCAAGIHYGFMIALRSIQGVASVSYLGSLRTYIPSILFEK